MTPIGAHTQRADLATAQTVAVPNGASHLQITATTQAIRLTTDGTAPTTTKGTLIPAATYIPPIPVPRGGDVKMIETATTATVDYQFFNIQI